MTTGRLVLTPKDPAFGWWPMSQCREALAEMGLLGAPLPWAGDRYLVGPRFLQQITFLGCSPRLELEPAGAGDTAFCHLHLEGPLEQPRLLWGPNSVAPRCPACHGRLQDWRYRIRGWAQDPTSPFPCPHCAREVSATSLDWRRQGGVGSTLIQIEQVFPGEAIPAPELMRGLERASGTGWHHFYIFDSEPEPFRP